MQGNYEIHQTYDPYSDPDDFSNATQLLISAIVHETACLSFEKRIFIIHLLSLLTLIAHPCFTSTTLLYFFGPDFSTCSGVTTPI